MTSKSLGVIYWSLPTYVPGLRTVGHSFLLLSIQSDKLYSPRWPTEMWKAIPLILWKLELCLTVAWYWHNKAWVIWFAHRYSLPDTYKLFFNVRLTRCLNSKHVSKKWNTLTCTLHCKLCSERYLQLLSRKLSQL